MKEKKEKLVIGLPRGLHYYRFGKLWEEFFENLGLEVLLSGPTTRKTLEEGKSLINDDTCLSMKIFMGQVASLIGRCDYIFVPRIRDFGRQLHFCVRFEALYDLCRNIFKDTDQDFLTFSIDEKLGQGQEAAFIGLGKELGFSHLVSRLAYKRALEVYEEDFLEKVQDQEALFNQKGEKILLAGHAYVLEDAYVGRQVINILKGLGAVPIKSYLVDRKEAIEKSRDLSPTNFFVESREILGSIELNRDRIDGIILISAYPCNTDPLTNEVIEYRIKDIPILNLLIDEETGSAGIETRLESFLDIIRFKEASLAK